MSVEFDVQHIKDRILFGIPFEDPDGKPFPDDMFQFYLDSAIAWAEQSLNIAIQPRTIEETHDFIQSDYVNWGYVRLHKKPVIKVETMALYYGDRPMLEIPESWLKVDEIAGAIQLFPTAGATGGIIIDRSGAMVLPLMSGSQYVPQMWRVTYSAGMTEPDDVQAPKRSDIHANLKEVIYKKAAIGVLGVYGELIIGSGIANQSISLDGVSQSIGTTQSAMYGGASARIQQLQEDIDTNMPTLRAFYGGIDMVVV